ncbi:MAG: ATP-binding cassette domain-containing protein [Chloroflexi bacterium]|nr:ATP-binding cassette domain-containing protein [Chloroflexota bacterium]
MIAIQESTLLRAEKISMEFVSRYGFLGRHQHRVRALDSVDLEIQRGETLGIVGESGCGKTTLGRCLIRLITPTAGRIVLDGVEILALDASALRHLRREMQMVFQNPFSSLNPRMKVDDLVAEPLRTHTDLAGGALEERVEELLVEVGLGAEHMKRHPHQLSGGQAQRVALSRALALSPKFLVLDEPTSALDVSVQAQIINLLSQLQERHGLTYLFISHDLSVVRHISDRIAVMYLGQIVELASSDAIFNSPQHPYTQALISSTPVPDPDSGRERIILEGNVPSPANPPAGCRFHTRCPYVMDICRRQEPKAHAVGEGHWAACHLLDKAPSDSVIDLQLIN